MLGSMHLLCLVCGVIPPCDDLGYHLILLTGVQSCKLHGIINAWIVYII